MKYKHFIAFNLDDFHKQSNSGATVRVKFIGAKDLDGAKDLASRHYGGAWAVVPRQVFDKGIVLAREGSE